MEYPFIFGTAGHIDHGKTALVKALTGEDCDRLRTEKERGITIELGFAPLHLPSGKTVSIVDVPGHERFIRTMASGAAGMDAAMLVVAASEGVMPQTREHLDILNILGVRFGLIALTKKDLSDADTLELAASEVKDLVQGSCLEAAPIIPVSSVTGDGIADIVAEIDRIIEKIPIRKSTGAFFLPIDRVFIKKGFGSVVTGTLYQGSIACGDELDIMPYGERGRVRTLQTHGTNVPSVTAGQRVAVNIAGISPTVLVRGAALCAKGAFIASDCLNAHLEVLSSSPQPIMHHQRVRLHIGTADLVARISLLHLGADERKFGIKAGKGAPVQILCESKIAAAAGQRFVIRFYSPLVTIGGGRVMMPNALLARGKAERESLASLVEKLFNNFTPVNLLAALVAERGIVSADSLFELSQMDKNSFDSALDEFRNSIENHGVSEFGSKPDFIANETFDALVNQVQRILHEFHASNPELSGLEAEKLFAAMDSVHVSSKISLNDFRNLVSLMAAKKNILPTCANEGGDNKIFYRAEDYKAAALDSKFLDIAERTKAAIAAAGFNLLKLSDLETKLNISASSLKRALAYLRQQEDLRTIDGGLLFSKDVRDKLLKTLKSMEEAGKDITVAALRDALGVNRKESLAMLDFMDSSGITKRDGDKRSLS
ncbi:MAG: selenocysteine-specific translation elongation factor [Termitinemataceae bacterium]|nr:MAG: selenocysteine-specific translation elongation factor [Termitinemataceae bacterium]